MQAKQIGIAIVESDGRFLVGVRGPDGPLPGFAEFPGGKCLPGESHRDCAVRECREETGIHVDAEELLDERVFEYDHGSVHLHFWRCTVISNTVISNSLDTTPKPLNGFRWVFVKEMSELPFPEANAPVVESLIGRFEQG